jgi:uncharacterized protein
MASTRRTTPACQPGFARRYGPWAVVAGASEGLGAAYACALARRRISLVLVARRRPVLEALARDLCADFGVEVRCLDGDLADRHFLEGLLEACSTLEIGLLVYNAAHAPVGEFVEAPLDDLLRVAAVNIRAPVTLVRGFATGMIARGHGGVILMTSLAGNQGSPHIATYAASKAFNRVLAEGLWYELRAKGVDVLACCAGAVRTPGYSGASEGRDAPGTLDAGEVVEQALRALGRGPVVIPGRINRVASFFMTRVLPKRRAISIMARNTAEVLPAAAAGSGLPALGPRPGDTGISGAPVAAPGAPGAPGGPAASGAASESGVPAALPGPPPGDRGASAAPSAPLGAPPEPPPRSQPKDLP